MLPHPDTYVAIFKIERELAATRADRLAPVYAAASEHRSAPAQAGTPVPPWGRLVHAVRTLHWILRPSHA